MTDDLDEANDANARGIDAQFNARLSHRRPAHADALHAGNQLPQFAEQGSRMLIAGGFPG